MADAHSRRSVLCWRCRFCGQRSVQLDCSANNLVQTVNVSAIDVDWAAVRKLAAAPSYKVLTELTDLVREVANELKVRNPYDPN